MTRIRKNSLVLFTKPPVPGLVKTRLTYLKDGVFTPEDAARLYEAMLLDVVEVICAAFDQMEHESDETPSAQETVRDEYELVISTTPAQNVPVMEQLLADHGPWGRDIVVIADEGASFDEHYNDAFEQTWTRGADCILSMGADMPALTVMDVVYDFQALHEFDGTERGGIVLSPDQAMGVSIVGWTRQTDFDHTGVFYNADGLTVLPAYVAKARDRELPAKYLPAVPDVDTIGDLVHNVTLVEALCYTASYDGNVAPRRTAAVMQDLGLEVRVPPNDLHDPREDIDK